MKKIVFLALIIFSILGMGCVSSSKTIDNSATSAEMNVSKTPDEKPLVEYHISIPYSQDRDNWIKEYALEHRTSN